MSGLFSRPKPPKITVPTPAQETPPPPPAPPLPPPAPEAVPVQEEAEKVRQREGKKGRKRTVLTSPLGVAEVGTAPKTLLGG